MPAAAQGDTEVGDKTLRINEIFHSLQGETSLAGLPTVFIRLTGCPLRCQYCDTAYAFDQGERMRIDDILHSIATYQTRLITVTGGEPLAQKDCPHLLTRLCEQGYQVSLETSGAIDVARVDARVIKILDIKTPGSGEADRNLFANLDHLNPHDQIKFVICDREDYEWSKQKLIEFQLRDQCEVLFSASQDQLGSKQLADWILEDRLPVRLQIQLHKFLWGDGRGK